MKTIALKGEPRTDLGSKYSKQLREEGKVPCVLYGEAQENKHFAVYAADFKNLVYTPNTYTVQIDLDGNKSKAILKDLQFHPVSDAIVHADFQLIDESKPVTIDIPVKITGNSPGVRAGGKLVTKIKKLRVKGLLNELPDAIEVSIDALEIGKSVKVGDMKQKGLTFLDSAANAIVSVETTRASIEAGAAAAKA